MAPALWAMLVGGSALVVAAGAPAPLGMIIGTSPQGLPASALPESSRAGVVMGCFGMIIGLSPHRALPPSAPPPPAPPPPVGQLPWPTVAPPIPSQGNAT